jgi:hypothetical protein
MELLHLAGELLELIFRHDHKDSRTTDVVLQICVSKKWIEIFLPILYQDVVLRTAFQIRSFAQISPPNASLVRSITLALSFDPVDFEIEDLKRFD